MLNSLIRLWRPLLFGLDPERAHELTLRSLEAGFFTRPTAADAETLSVQLLGRSFPNPIGISAGFDKDARVFDQILKMGFGFAEVGTVTPFAQRGNTKPRVFRLIRDRAVINRLGFNNRGHNLSHRLLSRRDPSGVVGVNLGANKDSEDKVADYVLGLRRFYDLADYIMVNISSPNTPGLRDLQAPAALDDLLARIFEVRAELETNNERRVPIAVKLSPDIADIDLGVICERLIDRRVDAIAISNTTLSRPDGLDPLFARESGGLSGRPLFRRSTKLLARVYQITGGAIPLIGIGGIESGQTALAKIEAGASLIQLYTGLIYEGPDLLQSIKDHLDDAVRQSGNDCIGAIVGRRAEDWANDSVEM
ncbi:MAG: quinone-dependent dihydroorotate dehydrogenase [Hyphomicrobiaceae bacterium]